MSNVTFREAVEGFEAAVRDDQNHKTWAIPPSEVKLTYAATKARLLAFDPGDRERAAEDRYAEAHEFDVPIVAGEVQPPGVSHHAMVAPMSDLARELFDVANATNAAIAASLRAEVTKGKGRVR